MASLQFVYQGEPGCYSEAAAIKTFGPNINGCPKSSFEEVFIAVEKGEATHAVIPIENSLGGSVHINYDYLLRYHSLKIIKEIHFKVSHCLLALPGATLDTITRVISHPQALAQCDQFLRNKGLTPVSEYDTAGSAKIVSKSSDLTTAAIASEIAAKTYNLKILEKNIEDDEKNYTRFLVLVKSENLKTTFKEKESENSVQTSSKGKTLIAFTLVDKPGILYKALSIFAFRDIDLSKIESRPARYYLLKSLEENCDDGRTFWNRSFVKEQTGETERPYQALFYLDFLALIDEERVRNAIRQLSEIAPFVRILGSFLLD